MRGNGLHLNFLVFLRISKHSFFSITSNHFKTHYSEVINRNPSSLCKTLMDFPLFFHLLLSSSFSLLWLSVAPPSLPPFSAENGGQLATLEGRGRRRRWPAKQRRSEEDAAMVSEGRRK
ncbi:Uncharacterized protein RDABS01_036083, partial [Bienertia sinuspersici]